MSADRAVSRYRKPETAPSMKDVQNLEAWDALIDRSIERAAASAEKWYAGLAGFVAVITSILLFKGPDSAQAMAFPWNLVVIGLLVAGASLTIAGFWCALSASAPPNPRQKYQEVIAAFGTIRNQAINAANRSDAELKRAKRLVAAALVVLMAGIVTWWLAPAAAGSPPPMVAVVVGPNEVCGEFVSSHDGYLLVRPADASEPVVVRLEGASSVRVVDACSA